MKLIIDIPDHVYEWVKNTGKFGMYRLDTAKVIQNGIPLDDVKAEIEEYRSTIDRAISEDELKIEGMKEAYTDCLEIINKYIGKEN